MMLPNKALDPTVRAASLRSGARTAAHREIVRQHNPDSESLYVF